VDLAAAPKKEVLRDIHSVRIPRCPRPDDESHDVDKPLTPKRPDEKRNSAT
jgi:hypothetical protein